METALSDAIRARIKNLEAMPAMPSILGPLLRSLELPPEQIEVDRVAEMISCDKSIAAQCLRMANSALFYRQKPIESVRGAVIALGARRLRDVLWSCYLVRMVPKANWPIDPNSFWEHSFACALVSQQLAKKISAPDPDKAYLCGLLHDIGEVLNATLLPEDFRTAASLASAKGISLFEAEKVTMGFTHCETGRILADYWALPDEASQVIQFHHTPELGESHSALVALVNLSDLLCRMRDMGYGYLELREIEFQKEPAWSILLQHAPHLGRFDVFRFSLEMDQEADEIRKLVTAVFSN